MPRAHSDLVLLLDALVRLHGPLSAAFAESRAGSGLSAIEHTVLSAVAEAQRPPTVPQIGRALGHPRQVIQRAANALIEHGLVTQRANPEHKRANLLDATAEGRALQERGNARAAKIAAELLRSIDAGDVREATALLNRIRTQLQALSRKDAA